MVQEHRGEYPSLWAAVESIAPKIGCVSRRLLEHADGQPSALAGIWSEWMDPARRGDRLRLRHAGPDAAAPPFLALPRPLRVRVRVTAAKELWEQRDRRQVS